MNLRLLLLAALALLGMFGVARLTWSPAWAAERILLAAPSDAAALAGQGMSSLVLAVWRRDSIAALPFAALGFAMGAVMHLWVRWWRRPQTATASADTVLVDYAGVKFRMVGCSFDHAPAPALLNVGSRKTLAADASVLAKEAVGAIDALDPPADLGGKHGVRLAQHTRHVFERVAAQEGAGSIAATTAALHDLPKVLAYEHVDGHWRGRGANTNALAGLALLQLPTFWHMSAEERNRFMLLSLVVTTGDEPLDLPADLKTAAVTVWAADRASTQADKQPQVQGQIDLLELCAAARTLLAEVATWNVNSAIRNNDVAEAFFAPDDRLLLVEAHRLRRALATRVSAQLRAQLSLDVVDDSLHAGDDVIMQALQMEGIAANVAVNVRSESGWFRIAHGRSRDRKCAALLAGQIDPDLLRQWGHPRKEITIEAA